MKFMGFLSCLGIKLKSKSEKKYKLEKINNQNNAVFFIDSLNNKIFFDENLALNQPKWDIIFQEIENFYASLPKDKPLNIKLYSKTGNEISRNAILKFLNITEQKFGDIQIDTHKYYPSFSKISRLKKLPSSFALRISIQTYKQKKSSHKNKVPCCVFICHYINSLLNPR